MRRRRREEEPSVTGEEPSARCFSAPVRYPARIASVTADHVLLIAALPVARALQRQPFSVVAEIRFGVFSTERYLSNGREMRLARDRAYLNSNRR
jgi:hypothetical protein